jgi:hypothetical protein
MLLLSLDQSLAAIQWQVALSDVVALKVEDSVPDGYAVERGRASEKRLAVPVEVTEQTQHAVDDYIRAANRKSATFCLLRRDGRATICPPSRPRNGLGKTLVFAIRCLRLSRAALGTGVTSMRLGVRDPEQPIDTSTAASKCFRELKGIH